MTHSAGEARRRPGAIALGLLVVAMSVLLAWWLWPRTVATATLPAADDAGVGDVRPGTAGDAAAFASPLPLPVEPETADARMARFSTYESRFRADTRDPAWAVRAEQALLEAASEPALAQYGIPGSFHAECLARLCKIAMRFETQGQALDWAELYVNGMAGTATSVQTMVSPLAGGGAELIVYGAREGSESLLHAPAPRADRNGRPVPE
jgi:hypothetical protein